MRSNVLVLIILVFILFAPAGFAQQLRLGDNPAGVEKSAVLELVSTNQGLLLPRITDSSLINALNPPNGMVIYYAPSNKILIRSNFAWQEVVSANNMRFSTLADAQINLPSNGQILTYNNGRWVNTTAPFLTQIDTTDIANFSQKVIGIFSGASPISINANGQISISQAGAGSNGYLSSSDWNTFNNKQPAGNYITALTGDVTATGPGSAAATIAPNAVTYDKIQTMTSNKLLGSGATGTSVTEISLGSGLSFTGNTLNVTNNGGTVSSFSAGNLAPLFSTSVSNSSTTPALSFTLNSQSPNLVLASPVSSSGTPLFRSLAKTDLPSSIVYNDQSNTFTSGSKQIFSASNILADIRLSGYTSDPSTLSNGDVWFNSTSHLFKYRANGTTRIFANTDEAQTFTNKTISGSANTLTNIPNSSLVNSTIALTLGTSGTDANVSGTPASLGGTLTLNIPTASSTSRGLLSAADWIAFNSKGTGTVTSVGLSLPSIFTVTGTPVTSSGTLTASLVSQSANTFFAGPSGAAGTPSFRALVANDIPGLDWSKITSGKPTTLAGYGITDGFIQDGNSFGTSATLGTNDNHPVIIETNNSEKLRVTSAGDVGIATNSPSATLDVNGNFKLGSGGTVLNNIIKSSVTVTNTTSFNNSTTLTLTVTVAGAQPNATVIVNPRSALSNRLAIGYAYVSAPNTIKINIINTGSSTSLGTETFDITLIE